MYIFKKKSSFTSKIILMMEFMKNISQKNEVAWKIIYASICSFLFNDLFFQKPKETTLLNYDSVCIGLVELSLKLLQCKFVF